MNPIHVIAIDIECRMCYTGVYVLVWWLIHHNICFIILDERGYRCHQSNIMY